MSSISPLTRILLASDTEVSVSGRLGHYEVFLDKGGERVVCSLAKVLSTIQELSQDNRSGSEELKNKLQVIQNHCKGSADIVENVLGVCEDILQKECKEQAREINEEKIPLHDYLQNNPSMDVHDLFSLAPYLTYVDLSVIDEDIQEQCEGGVDSFIQQCSKMEYLNVLSHYVTKIESASLLTLCCASSPALVSINTPHAKELLCDGCESLLSLEAPEALEVHCNKCPSLQSIQVDLVKELLCDDCTSLASIEAPLAETIYCQHCIGLDSIHAPELSDLFCEGCSKLRTLTTPKVRFLNCCDCVSLKSIQLESLWSLYAVGCTSLGSIQAPALLDIDCRDCPHLTKIEAESLADLLEDGLAFSGCWRLTDIQLPANVFEHIKINKEDMKEQPEKYLSALMPYFLVRKKWPRVVYLEKDGSVSPAIDITGLAKDAQATLAAALFSSETPTFKLYDEDPLPHLEKGEAPKWRAFGCMMAIAFKHSYTIGSLFGSRFYESLKVAIHYSYRAKDDVDNLRKALVIRLYEDQLEEFKQYDMDENDLDEYIPKFVDPILALSCGFKSVLTLNELQQLGRLKPKAIQERVEGVLSAEAIIGKIVFREGVSAEVQGFVETWIRERADKPEQLKAFLLAVTGSPSISLQTNPIKVFPSDDGFLPASHTCFNELVLSNVSTQQKFDENMAVFLATAQEGLGFTDE